MATVITHPHLLRSRWVGARFARRRLARLTGVWSQSCNQRVARSEFINLVTGPSVQAAAVPTWPRRGEGDGSEGTPALWAR